MFYIITSNTPASMLLCVFITWNILSAELDQYIMLNVSKKTSNNILRIALLKPADAGKLLATFPDQSGEW